MSLKCQSPLTPRAWERIDDRLKAIGANYVQAGLWRRFAVRDGNLVTCQRNPPGEETARLVIEASGRRGE